jgi:hypothetical protein
MGKYSGVKDKITSKDSSAKVDPSAPENIQAMILKREFLYSIFGGFIGIVFIAVAVWLFITDTNVAQTVKLEMKGMKFELINVISGVISLVLGCLVLYFSRFNFSHNQPKK